jgi:hypothetical protein
MFLCQPLQEVFAGRSIEDIDAFLKVPSWNDLPDNAMINSNNPVYVMSRIRADYLGDSSVTVVLIGTCTHSRRYVEWELKASLQCGDSTPIGVVARLLPSAHNHNEQQYPYLPDRLAVNYRYLDNTT